MRNYSQLFRRTNSTWWQWLSPPDGRIENAAKSQVTPIAGIHDIESSQKLTEVARYTIDGRRISQPQKGVNIVKLSDGTTFKVLVK